MKVTFLELGEKLNVTQLAAYNDFFVKYGTFFPDITIETLSAGDAILFHNIEEAFEFYQSNIPTGRLLKTIAYLDLSEVLSGTRNIAEHIIYRERHYYALSNGLFLYYKSDRKF